VGLRGNTSVTSPSPSVGTHKKAGFAFHKEKGGMRLQDKSVRGLAAHVDDQA
jgi:hypothetical protein